MTTHDCTAHIVTDRSECCMVRGERARATAVRQLGEALVEAAELRRVVARVKALADEWERSAGPGSRAAEAFGPQKVSVEFVVQTIRAALSTEATS